MTRQISFFDHKELPAVLKHGVVSRYPDIWGKKVGSTSMGNRIFAADCYAGRGDYDDGSPGSPLLLAHQARKFVENKKRGHREMECFYVEKDRSRFDHLTEVLARVPHSYTAQHGDIEDYVDEMVGKSLGVPALFFVDPFGTPPSFDALTKKMMGRHGNRAGLGVPSTEIVLTFMLSSLPRACGHLTSTSQGYVGSQQESRLKQLDRALGSGWRAIREKDAPDWEMEIFRDYLANLQDATGAFSYVVPVPERWGGEPVYLLVLLTRNQQGVWYFNEAASYAVDDFYRRSWEEEGRLALWDREAMAIEQVTSNLLSLRGRYPFFRLRDHIDELYRGVAGHARHDHVEEALNSLEGKGLTWNHASDVFKAEVRSQPQRATGTRDR